MPNPRYDFYEHSSYNKIQNSILALTDELTDSLGFYNLNAEFDLLKAMRATVDPLMFIGLIFDVLLILFIVIAVLLIYSLLIISVETKTFETGVMRLVGLSKRGFVALVFTEAICFVIPSVVVGFLLSIPSIWMVY